MKRFALPLIVAAFVGACAGSTGKDNPHKEDPATNTGNGTGNGTTTTRTMPPGTTTPTASKSIVRYEPENAATGAGLAKDPEYDAANDTFKVDNLPFDGDNIYARDDMTGTALEAQLGPFRVYENENFITDPVNGTTITQFQHKAVVAKSASGKTELAIVRTGQYTDFGFGGFMYTRNGRVTLPASGFARYTGSYAGIRDFSGTSGVEFVSGTADVSIDFNDFNNGYAVDGTISDRRVFDVNGNDITTAITAALATEHGVPFTSLPVIQFKISNALDKNGEMLGSVNSKYFDANGAVAELETGQFYGIVAGSGATEVVGIIVVTSDDPRQDGITVRETGGFIATR